MILRKKPASCKSRKPESLGLPNEDTEDLKATYGAPDKMQPVLACTNDLSTGKLASISHKLTASAWLCLTEVAAEVSCPFAAGLHGIAPD